VGVEWVVLNDESIKPSFQIMPGGWVGVFLNHKTRGGVLHQYGAQAGLRAGFADDLLHFRGDFV
jgi:hypothetical protein